MGAAMDTRAERDIEPPDAPRGASGDLTIYVERDGVEVEVEVVFDEGAVFSATTPDGRTIDLTPRETQDACEAWVEEQWAAREDYEADAYDRAGDR